MNGHDVFEMLDAYALGTLPPADAERVRAHLAGCAACRAEYDEVRNVLDVLPLALPAEPVPAGARDRLFARLDAEAVPVPGPDRLPMPRRRGFAAPLVGALAAALLLALAGDAWLAARLTAGGSGPAVVARATAVPAASPALQPRPRPRAAALARVPAAPKATPDPRVALLTARVAELEAALRAERLAARDGLAARDARIAELRGALAHATASLVAMNATSPPPGAAPSSRPPASPELVAALSSGRVYGVDGTVGGEAWHLTIVQPPAGANALIYSDVPHAPPGDTYRTWVVRDGKTFDAGELPAGTRAKLEMPMPLQAGDVVAFSREAVGSGDRPTNAFLMQVKI